jgi:hypothetical protein
MTTTPYASQHRCMDSGTQVMAPAKHGDLVACGNCGAVVPVVKVPPNNDPDDHNTIRVLAEHNLPYKTTAEVDVERQAMLARGATIAYEDDDCILWNL